MRSLAEVTSQLPTSTETGLSADAVALSRSRHGVNRLTPLPREPLWKKFLAKFDEPIIHVLLAAALLSIFVDLFRHATASGAFGISCILLAQTITVIALAALLGRRRAIPALLFVAAVLLWPAGLVLTGHASVDGLAVMVAVVLATGVAFLSEYRSHREFELLNARKDTPPVKVRRAGRVVAIPLEEVVVGELVLLEAGDEVPADGRVIYSSNLQIDQSLMTGEPEPAVKLAQPDEAADGPEQPGCVYRGTQVVEGVGRMVAVEVGDATYLGQIARRLGEADAEASAESRARRKLTIARTQTPLQQKLERLAVVISRVGYLAAAAIFVALVVRGILTGAIRFPVAGEETGSVLLEDARVLLHAFLYMVIVIVVAVPEGLPMSVTLSLALAMRKMTRANSLVRQLAACETVGATTVICSDKTGTLTQNRMQVVRVGWGDEVKEREVAPPDWLALIAAVNATAHLEERDGRTFVIGNPTEGALLQWLRETGVDYRALRRAYSPLCQVHFSSERKRMTTVVRRREGLAALVKGAPEWVLDQSTQLQTADGARAWTPELRAAVRGELQDAAAQAMRTLAFGYALLPEETPAHADGLHACCETFARGLVYVGFVAIRDPLRTDVPAALADCRRAGIDVKMVTGDNPETARAIAAEAGLLDRPDALALTSAEFNALTDDELHGLLPRLRILARARPLDKLRLVRLLQERGEVVAVTGDGTNDAPALQSADVGLSMGLTGTAVAREASKIVLLDDAFSTIVRAVHWGRALYENIQRFLQFQLTINASALVIAFVGPFLGVDPPFTVLQLLWINVIMDTLAAIALCSEPPRPGLMRRPPVRRDANILTRAMLGNIGATASFFVVAMLWLLLGMKHEGWFAGPGSEAPKFPGLTLRQASIFFTVYVFFQVWNEINCRSLVPEDGPLDGLWRNPFLVTVAGVIVVVQVLVVTYGGALFDVEPLDLATWSWIVVGTSSVLLFSELVRQVRVWNQET